MTSRNTPVPPAPDINVDERAYFRWLIKYDEKLALFRVPFEGNLDQFVTIAARQASEEFQANGSTPQELFDRLLNLCDGYANAIIPLIGPDGANYRKLSINGQSAVASVATRIECARHLLLHKYRFKEAVELDNVIQKAME